MREALARFPGRSVWIPDTLEYALVGSWRNRPEIASVDELVAVRNVEPLLRAAQERSIACGDALFLAVELETQRGASRYERAGMELLEEVITYEIDAARVPRMPQRRFRRVPSAPDDRDALDRLIDLDRRAFPWLWRNSREEFMAYLATPGVLISFIEAEGQSLAYVGTTLFTGWGHLDRIAVEPELQGRGIGRAALTLAVDALRQRGARHIGLSTQRTNERSQRLYERFGFRRTPDLDYQLYGAWNRSDRKTARSVR
jgi:ribosomal protein S18 acetylase RimI-like enzyme